MRKTGFFILILGVLCSSLLAQPERIGAGLSFASRKTFNTGDTGNPGIVFKVWVPLDKRQVLNLVPSITAYNPHRIKLNPTFSTMTYMFHGDIDVHYRVLQDRTLIISAMAGINYTHIISKVHTVISVPDQPVDDAVFGFGPNVGASLEMRMHSHWDFILTAKYCFGGMLPRDPLVTELASLSALVLQIQGVYYFTSRGKAFYRQ